MDATTTAAGNPVGRGAHTAVAPFVPALRSVSFCSCYVYSPRGGGYTSAASRLLCTRVKSGDPHWLPPYAGQVLEQTWRHRELASLFGKEVVLVPVPGSAPSASKVWAAQRLAVALHGVGLGQIVWPGIERRFPVRKSATALNGDRPKVRQHYESFSVTGSPSITRPERFVLIDDVITKGRTILAAAIRLYESFPNTDIRAFALVRTMGFLSRVTDAMEPCEGFVTWAGGDARREP